MKAFLLAAGQGTRLRPLTDSTPKCLMKIGSDTLLGIWLKLLRRHEIDSVLINTHYLSSKVKYYVIENRIPGLSTVLFYEPILLGTATTIAQNRSFVQNEDFFYIIYADNLTNMDLTKFREFHLAMKSSFTVGLFNSHDPTQCGFVQCDDQHRIVYFEEKPTKPKGTLAAAGIYIANSSIFEYIPDKPNVDFGYNVLPHMVNKMYGYFIEEFFMDIGTTDQLNLARQEWLSMTEK